MELAKVTSKGQITIPVAIRRALGIKDGDKVMFIEREGKVIMMNASLDALLEAQQAFSGATHVMIEQKSAGKNLMEPIRQSDGTLLTPFQQARRYSAELPYPQRPR